MSKDVIDARKNFYEIIIYKQIMKLLLLKQNYGIIM